MITITFDKLITYISSVGTFISAIAALYAIWLTIFQRRLSYKPNLVIDTLNIKMNVNDFNGFHVDILQAPTLPQTKFSNIGLGAAISLRYHWDFNYKKHKSIFRVVFEKIQKEDKSFTTDSQYGMFKIIKERKVYMYNTLSTPYDIDFSLPYSIDKKSKNIFVPTAAIDILLNIAYLSHRLKLVGSSSFTGPKLIIEYQDIEGKTKKVTWQTKLERGVARFSGDNMEADFALRFTPVPEKWTTKGLEKIRKSAANAMFR
ncbi:hypothetical protein [Escherichia coli]|uniref:hypothetical protein n=1 Tax=Escherichia coli TaxID=562 RepID=UPI00388D42E9